MDKFLDLYRWGTMPWRLMRIRQMIQDGRVPLIVLFYHRVADDHPNPWTISIRGFERQIDWISRRFEFISLAECQNRIRAGCNTRPAISITFDDGYADNCTFALPLLIERNIPVTYFVTTHHPLNNQAFPHDVRLGTELAPNSIESLQALAHAGIEIGGHTRMHVDLGNVSDSDVLFDEVVDATRELESLLETSIRYFAFPFGQLNNLNPAVFQLLKENGFAGVCSAYGGMNVVGGDEFHLMRIHGDPNFSRLKNWLTWDPRIRRIKNYPWKSLLHEAQPLAMVRSAVTRG
jgi:peptidoglycan/xylan/chitin deacetylase (PgdA/CDA1 family)